MRRAKLKIVCICQIDSRILVLDKNRLTNLWFFDSRIFGDEREINDLVDSRLIGPDSSISVRSRPDSDSHDLTLRPLPSVVRTSCKRHQHCRTRNKFELVPSKLDYPPRLVRNGTCIKCIRCGSTTGRSRTFH
jgi:hypothetical protein